MLLRRPGTKTVLKEFSLAWCVKNSSTDIVCPSEMETICTSVNEEVFQPCSAFVFSSFYGIF